MSRKVITDWTCLVEEVTGLPVVKLIWAQSRGGAIGKGSRIPWRLREDLEFFQRMTDGATVVMGRRTWDSLPASRRPLPGRRNIVLTRDAGFSCDGAERFPSLESALSSPPVAKTVWVIGGAGVYLSALPFAEEVYITEVDVEVEGADTFVPPLPSRFSLAEQGEWLIADNGINYRFTRYAHD